MAISSEPAALRVRAVRSCSVRCSRVDSVGRDGAVREDRDDVVGHLDEAAVDVESLGVVAAADAQLAVAQPADERAVAGRDAAFAVEQRQGDEIGRRVEHRRFRRDDDALKRAGLGGQGRPCCLICMRKCAPADHSASRRCSGRG